jgi:hypothetical protein
MKGKTSALHSEVFERKSCAREELFLSNTSKGEEALGREQVDF